MAPIDQPGDDTTQPPASEPALDTPLVNPGTPISDSSRGWRCGEVWGSDCQESVRAPGYRHGQHPNKETRDEVALNSDTPVEILSDLATDQDLGTRCAVAINEATPIKVLKGLAQDPEMVVQAGVACNPSTPIEIMDDLLTGLTVTFRIGIAKNPKTPIETLKLLAADKNRLVRARVAENPMTPVEILKTLATDQQTTVRIVMAKNPKTPIETLKLLTMDKNRLIRTSVGMSEYTPTDLLIDLAKDHNKGVRVSVAMNKRTPVETLTLLATDRYKRVRTKATNNPNFVSGTTNKHTKHNNIEPTDCRAEVDTLIQAVQSGEANAIDEAFASLASLEAGSVFIELFIRVEDATSNIDLDTLIKAARLPLPDHPREIVAAVRNRDMRALEAATSKDQPHSVLASLVLLVASLQDARRYL